MDAAGARVAQLGLPPSPGDGHRVWIDQGLCTGDGLCVQEASDVFEFDIDGLAYVKDTAGQLLTTPGAQTAVPDGSLTEVVESARKCPGACIHVVRALDGVEVEGPDAQP